MTLAQIAKKMNALIAQFEASTSAAEKNKIMRKYMRLLDQTRYLAS